MTAAGVRSGPEVPRGGDAPAEAAIAEAATVFTVQDTNDWKATQTVETGCRMSEVRVRVAEKGDNPTDPQTRLSSAPLPEP